MEKDSKFCAFKALDYEIEQNTLDEQYRPTVQSKIWHMKQRALDVLLNESELALRMDVSNVFFLMIFIFLIKACLLVCNFQNAANSPVTHS